jgi:hypothetical protein
MWWRNRWARVVAADASSEHGVTDQWVPHVNANDFEVILLSMVLKFCYLCCYW